MLLLKVRVWLIKKRWRRHTIAVVAFLRLNSFLADRKSRPEPTLRPSRHQRPLRPARHQSPRTWATVGCEARAAVD